MIQRIFFRGVFRRSASSNSPVHWTVCLKLNPWIECKLFHVPSTIFYKEETSQNVIEKNEISSSKILKVWKNITPREISKILKINLKDVGLLMPGLNVKPDDPIESFDIIAPLAKVLGYKLQVVSKTPKKPAKTNREKFSVSLVQPPSKPENLVRRPPVVTVMGHVDHGKTTLLDSLRNTSVVDQEFGGITQHIGAFSVQVKPGETITFIDTPGHAAFTAMRSRGAKVTDLIVLVIAADDGIMEQTLECIKIANEAGVPIIVAVNKIDKPTALPVDDIKQKLLWEGVQVEDLGGDVQLVPISALKKTNLDVLKDVILLQAELMELKGDPTGFVEAVVIESKKEKIGIVATLIIKRGTLKKEKIIVAGKSYARVRRMLNEKGVDYDKATPSTPVQVLGWKDLPSAGDEVFEVDSEKKARNILKEKERKTMEEKQNNEEEIIKKKASEDKEKFLEFKEKLKSFSHGKEKRTFYFKWYKEKQQLEKEGDPSPHLKILLKADVFGTLEVLFQILSSYNKDDECKFSIVNAAVGPVSPNDIETAHSFNALIYAFNVNVHETATDLMKEKPVEIRYHNILYKLIDDVKDELSARIPPVDEEKINGEAEVLQNFIINYAKKKVPVAGSRCIKGQLSKDGLYRIYRDDKIIYEGKLLVMKNEKIEVKTIAKGMECGLLFDSFPDKFKPGDKIICYSFVSVNRRTSWSPGF